ncbi:MAG: acyltransferase [Candidatus Acidiferrales bacterium]
MKTIGPPDAITNSEAFSFRDSTNLDFLRSAAVLMVFCVHFYDIWTGTGKNWGFVWHIGQLGVMMFFVHTCLVLMWSLDRSSLQGWRLFKSFYVRRAFRLYPLSIVCVLLAYYIDLYWQPVNLWQSLTLTQYLFYANHPVFPPAFTPLWSLPLEVEMYVALPALFLIFRTRPVKTLIAFWGVSVVTAVIQPEMGDRFLILRYVPCFLGGVIAWRLMRERDRVQFAAWLWPLAIAISSAVWMIAGGKFLPLGIAAFGICLGLAIPLFREIRWSAVTKASKIIARYSYGIYLTHFPIMVYVLSSPQYRRFKVIPPFHQLRHFARPVDFTLVAILTAATSVALYHLVEHPGIRLGQKVARSITSTYGPEVAPLTTTSRVAPS